MDPPASSSPPRPGPGCDLPPSRTSLPFSTLAVAALGGGLWVHGDPRWGSLVLAGAFMGMLWVCRDTRHRLAGTVALAVLAAAGWHGADRDPAPLPAETRTATFLRGRVSADPRPGLSGPRLVVDLEARRDRDTWQPARGRVRLGVRGEPRPAPARGDAVVFRGPLRPPRGFRNPGSGGYETYLRREGIAAKASARWPGGVLFARPGPGEAPLLSWRRRTAEAIAEAAPGQGGAVLRALALGDRSGLGPDTVEAFRRTGTAHVLAISGLHLGILGLLLVPALGRLLGRIPGVALARPVAPLARFLALPPLVAYAALSGFQTSTVRALGMAALLLAGTALSRPVSHGGLLAGTALLLALWHPPVLAAPGFQLSLAALAGLFWIAPAVLGRLPWEQPDPLEDLARRTGGSGLRGRLRAAARATSRGLARWTVYSAAAAAATTPLAVFHFGAGSLAGAVVSPAVIAVLGFGCLPLTLAGVLLHPLAPAVSVGLWKVAGAGAALVAGGLEWLSPHAPAVAWQALRYPEGVFGAAALLGAAVLALRRARSRRRTLGFILAGTALLVLPTGVRQWAAHRDTGLHLWALDVGQGQAVALRAPGCRWALVDGGGFPTSPFDVGARVVVPALEHLGAAGLDLVVSTHPHPDHLGGLVSVVRWGRPGEVWLPGSFAGDPRYGPLQEAAEEAGARIRWVGPGGHSGFLGPVPLEARWVSASGENDRSMVLRAGSPGADVLVAADLEVSGQRRLLDTGTIDPCGVLVAPHHGAASSLYPPFLAATAPAVVVVSAGGRRGLPAPEFLAAARDGGSAVYSTHLLGCVHARLGSGGEVAVQATPR